MKSSIFILFICILLLISGCAVEEEKGITCEGKIAGSGPYCHKILLAVSDDGLSWEKIGLIKEHASVPDAIVDKEGKMRVYFVDGLSEGIGAGIFDGEEWEFMAVDIAGGAVDPDILIRDGEYVLYYLDTGTGSLRITKGKHDIKYAVSGDGFEFEEKGLAYSEEGITDPDVFKIDGGWMLYVSLPNEGKLISASSTDGELFERTGEADFEGSVSSTIRVGSEYWMFYHGADERGVAIFRAVSGDGKEWGEHTKLFGAEEEFGEFGGVADPSVVFFEGRYYMAYKSFIRQ